MDVPLQDQLSLPLATVTTTLKQRRHARVFFPILKAVTSVSPLCLSFNERYRTTLVRWERGFINTMSHQTAMSQQKICYRAVGAPRNMPQNINLPVTACTQRPYSVHGTLTARKKLLQPGHGAHSV